MSFLCPCPYFYSNFTLLTLTLTPATINHHNHFDSRSLFSFLSFQSRLTLHPTSKSLQALRGALSLIAEFPVTRTNKENDRNHSGLADGTALPEDRLPRYFAKHGHADADPKSIKKQGGGKGNW